MSDSSVEPARGAPPRGRLLARGSVVFGALALGSMLIGFIGLAKEWETVLVVVVAFRAVVPLGLLALVSGLWALAANPRPSILPMMQLMSGQHVELSSGAEAQDPLMHAMSGRHVEFLHAEAEDDPVGSVRRTAVTGVILGILAIVLICSLFFVMLAGAS